MKNPIHIYYLHTDGELIRKPDYAGVDAYMRKSDFVVMYWRTNITDRFSVWNLLVVALAVGANPEGIKDLANIWGCNNSDADTYAEQINVNIKETSSGFMAIPKSDCGYGDTKLEALSNLCKSIGYKPQKMWGATFEELLEPRASLI